MSDKYTKCAMCNKSEDCSLEDFGGNIMFVCTPCRKKIYDENDEEERNKEQE